MPRYYFNVFNGQDIFDRVGVDLPSQKSVRMHMLSVALDHIEKLENQSVIWQLEAVDEAGKIVGTMDFGIEENRHRSS